MEFSYSFARESSITSGADATDVSFSPDLGRAPTYFSGELSKALHFREALSALHAVVTSDLRFQPRDKTAYKEWAAKKEQEELALALAKAQDGAARAKAIKDELAVLEKASLERSKPFLEARRQFFQFLYEKNRDFWFALDPVVTVHPDEVFFECLSRDESSYGRVGVDYATFKNVNELACGTTNVDYSSALYTEFQKIRTYKTTRLTVDPSGFTVKTASEDEHKEVKIDVPDSWVRAFLQVSSAMTLPAFTFELHPMDVHNLLFVLRRKKERSGPRALRFELAPGAPVRAVFEPWETVVECPRSLYAGPEKTVVRTWGRRRLLVLERLIPLAWTFRVHLLGKGLPSFWIADLGGLTFTLGLSGWTANDWAQSANFDLLAPRARVDSLTQQHVFDGLKRTWFRKPDELARDLGLDRAVVLGALGAWTQAGRAIYDLTKGVYRVRELARDPLPIEKLRFASEREAQAMELVVTNAVTITRAGVADAKTKTLELKGTVKDKARTWNVALILDADEKIIGADCGCPWHQHEQLRKGPCEHLLAVRLAHARR